MLLYIVWAEHWCLQCRTAFPSASKLERHATYNPKEKCKAVNQGKGKRATCVPSYIIPSCLLECPVCQANTMAYINKEIKITCRKNRTHYNTTLAHLLNNDNIRWLQLFISNAFQYL